MCFSPARVPGAASAVFVFDLLKQGGQAGQKSVPVRAAPEEKEQEGYGAAAGFSAFQTGVVARAHQQARRHLLLCDAQRGSGFEQYAPEIILKYGINMASHGDRPFFIEFIKILQRKCRLHHGGIL